MKQPKCHPDKPYGGKGLCNTCYMRAYRNGGKVPSTPPKVYGNVATCHPERKHRAFGLCNICYLKKYNRMKNPNPKPYAQIPQCHPERPHKARGLCLECYRKEPDVAAKIKAYADKNARRDQLKHHYGITIEQYDAMCAKQNGVCAICKRPPRGKMQRLSVDHCHKTGTVRGLLCITCNRTVGYLDNPDWLAQAQTYLSSGV